MTAMQLNYIANASVPSASGRTIAMIDPSDGQPFDEIQRSNADDIAAAVHAARQCYNAVWQKLAPVERGRLLQKLSAKILEHADELTALEQRDCGKPTKQARADPTGGRRAPLPRDAGTGRKKPADHLCRCGPRCRPPRGHQRHRAERRADLLGGLTGADRFADLRTAAGASGRGGWKGAGRARRHGA